MELASVAEELYGLEPSQFTAARDAAAKQARAEDRDLAAQIKGLKRASTSAWIVNMFVRRYPEEVAALADLGATLRDAHSRGDGDVLRALVPQRRQLISTLGALGRELATSLGHAPTVATSREVESTLDAALADEQATSAVRSGVLVRALKHVGEAVDVAGATAVPVVVSPALLPTPRAQVRPAPVRAVPPPDIAAKNALEQAESALGNATAARVAAESQRATAAAKVSLLEEELKQARVAATNAAQALRDAQEAERRARKSVETAARRVQRETGGASPF